SPVTAPLEHAAEVVHASFSPDGTRVVTASRDKSARIWDAATGEPTTPPLEHSYGLNQAEFSPDGRRVATATGEHIRGRFGFGDVRLWDSATGEPIGSPLAHNGGVTSVAFSPDGSRIVSTTDDFVAMVWDTATGQLLIPQIRH